MKMEINNGPDLIPLDIKELLNKGKYGTCMPGLVESANAGNMASALALAQIYSKGGGGVSVDFIAAKNWYLKYAGKRYHPSVFFQLGRMYYIGLGTEPNLKVAYAMFRHMAIKNSSIGRFMCGAILKEGLLTRKKKDTANTLLWRSFKDKKLGPNERSLALLKRMGFQITPVSAIEYGDPREFK
jgi:hypothetical protein